MRAVLVAGVVALAFPAAARADGSVELVMGSSPLRTRAFSGHYEYTSDGERHPLALAIPAAEQAFDLGLLFFWPGWVSGDLTVGPVLSGDVLIGGVNGLRGAGGVRAELEFGAFIPFAGAGVGVLHAWRSMGEVTGRELVAPDGSRAPVGARIDASLNALGVDAEVGAALKFGSWALVCAAGYSLYGFLGNWAATTTNYAEETVRLGGLSQVPLPSLSGLTFRAGLRHVFGF